MTFEIPKLPYPEDGLAPYISSQTVKYHYEKHTKKYYDITNELSKGTKFDKYNTLKELIINDIINADTKLFNNACQAWNHQFFWASLTSPDSTSSPSSELSAIIDNQFGSFNKFKDEFIETANEGFGSYWTWLVLYQGKLKIKNTPNAGCPLTTKGQVPLFVVDNWEHSYYLDYPADRLAYIKAIWNIINWEKINERFKTST